MSMIQSITAGAFVAVAVSAAISLVIPEKPIAVHSLSYQNGNIVQDRTIEADGDVFFMRWQAEIVNANTGRPLPHCVGSGSWNYTAGRLEVAIPLSEWTGSEFCTPSSLPPGEYYPRAVYIWGDNQLSARGEAFTVKE